MIKTIDTGKVKVTLVELPEGATNINVTRVATDLSGKEWLSFWHRKTADYLNQRFDVPLPPGVYTLLATSNEVTEEQLRELKLSREHLSSCGLKGNVAILINQ